MLTWSPHGTCFPLLLEESRFWNGMMVNASKVESKY